MRLQGYVNDYCHKSLLKSVNGNEGELVGTSNEKYQLVQVHALIRHGDRSPIRKFDTQPTVNYECGMIDKNEKWLGLSDFNLKPNPPNARIIHINTPLFRGFESKICEMRQLTFEGSKQLYSIGSFFKRKYSHIVDTILDQSNVFIQCTDYRRTIHSASSFALGFLPDTSSVRKSIPIYVSNGNLLVVPPPNILQEYPDCKKIIQVNTLDKKASGYDQMLKTKRHAIDHLASIMNVRDSQQFTMADVFDQVWCRLCHNMPLPCGLKSCVNESLALEGAKVVHWSFSHRYPNKTSILAAQPYIYHSFVRQIDLAILNSNLKKPYFKFLFSFAHDSTITQLLTSLGVYESSWFPYATRIVVELWKDKTKKVDDPNTHFVRILLNGKSVMNTLHQYPVGYFESDGQLLSYTAWRESMVTGTYRDLETYKKICL